MTQPGRLPNVVEALGGLAEALRRRRAGPPVVRLYDAEGNVRTLDADAAQAQDLRAAADRFSAAAVRAGAPVDAEPGEPPEAPEG